MCTEEKGGGVYSRKERLLVYAVLAEGEGLWVCTLLAEEGVAVGVYNISSG